jgi:transposase
MTDDLLALADWLAAENVTHVAMESTGVALWKPLFNLLEYRFQRYRTSVSSAWSRPAS